MACVTSSNCKSNQDAIVASSCEGQITVSERQTILDVDVASNPGGNPVGSEHHLDEVRIDMENLNVGYDEDECESSEEDDIFPLNRYKSLLNFKKQNYQLFFDNDGSEDLEGSTVSGLITDGDYIDDEERSLLSGSSTDGEVNVVDDGEKTSGSSNDGGFLHEAKNGLERYIVRSIQCPHQRNYVKCACMYTMKFGKDKWFFDKDMLKDLVAINYELRLRELSKYKSFEAGSFYYRHPAVIVALTSKDKKIVCDPCMNRDEFMKFIYEVREHYNVFSDFGEKPIMGVEFNAESISETFNGFIEMIKNSLNWTFKTLEETLKYVFDKIMSIIHSIVGLISETLGKMLDHVFDKIREILFKFINPIDFINGTFTNKSTNRIIIVVAILLTVLIIDIIGFFTYKLCISFIDRLFKLFEVNHYAQGPEPDPIVGIVSLFGIILGLAVKDMDSIAKKARNISALVSGGLSVSFALSSLFIVLPVVFQASLRAKFGTQESKDRLLVEEWLIRSSAILRLKRIPKLLISEDYYKWLSELITEAQGFKSKIKNPVVGNIFIRNLVGLTEIVSILENYRKEKCYRDYPYSLHICAPPGYGKTLFVSKFVTDLFDVNQNEIYTRPIASEFWDGFISQKVVIVDEFLIGDSIDKTSMGKEYLELVSTKTFKPPLASIDDPSVGVKGTKAEPIGVVTINNTAYERVSNLSSSALWRRREFVIELKIADDKKHLYRHNKVDLSRMTDAEINSRAWLSFDLKTPEPDDSRTLSNLKYNELLIFLKQHRESHLKTCERIRAGQESDIGLEKTPTELLDDALREIRGIPNEPISFTDSIFNLMSSTKDSFMNIFTAQSKDSTETQTMDERELGESYKNAKKIISGLKKKHKKASKEHLQRMEFNARCLYNGLVNDFSSERNDTIIEELKQAMLKFKREHKLPGYEEQCSTDTDYESVDSYEEPKPQRDMVSDLTHSNVDTNVYHRHQCLGVFYEPVLNANGNQMIDVTTQQGAVKKRQCTRHFTHRHDKDVVHGFLCKQCTEEGNKQDYVSVHGGLLHEEHKLPDLLPEEFDYECIDHSDEYRKKINKMWADICVDKFVRFGTTPIIVFDNPEYNMGEGLFYQLPPVKDLAWQQAKTLSLWLGVFVAIYSIRKFFTKSKVNAEDQVYFSQSNKAQRETRGSRRPKQFSKAYAQSGGELIMEINGVEHNAIPIQGHTFVTYYHAFLVNGELIPDQTPMKIKWKGAVTNTVFDINNVKISAKDDLAFVTFYDKKMSTFPNNFKKFWTLQDVEDFKNTSAVIDISNQQKYVTVVKAKNKNYSFYNMKFEMDECLMYKYPTKKGDCGSAITSVGQICPGKILGMHVAGGSTGFDHFGLSVIITKEDIEEALKEVITFEEDITFHHQGPELFEGPNLLSASLVDSNDRVYLNRVSKIKPSAITDDLMTRPKKHLPLLSKFDDRSDGQDPVVNMINDSLDIEQVQVDDELVEDIAEDFYQHLVKKMIWPIGKRRLTFEEALEGVPGMLSSLKVNSSAGFPLCKINKGKGKRDFFHFDQEGKLHYEEWFKIEVINYLEILENEGIDERRFIAFLKDELTSKTKIEAKRCRIIYCGDLISNVAYRILFGHLLCAFNHSYMTTSSAIGLNQYSHDMHIIYDYLREVGDNFVAGDFKNFDKRMHGKFQQEAYKILMKLSSVRISAIAKNSFVKQQMKSSAQVLDTLIKFKVTHFSGCFFTTIVNNLVNEMYIRYVFQNLCPNKSFEENVRLKVLGDDHIYCFSDIVKDFMTPLKIQAQMKKIGQVYTSDVKERELTDEFRKFEDITFLGAHPILIKGKYCGALKKETLEETLHWTRNSNLSLIDECKTAIELSSIWGREYFEAYSEDVKTALEVNEIGIIEIPNFNETVRIVSSRTAGSGEDFPYGFVAQGPPSNSLAKLNEHKITMGGLQSVTNMRNLGEKSLNETSMGLDFGTDSRVFRTQFEWNPSDVVGTAIQTFDVPFGLLGLGDSDNVQNMPFDRFAFWNGNVELIFQINGTPFQQGLLIAYFVPLASYEVELANIVTCSHVKMQPDQSATYSLMIPYRYLRSVMNTIARSTESLGTVFVTPISGLVSVDGEPTTVSLYTSFPNSSFTIPRPLTAPAGMNKFYSVYGNDEVHEILNFTGKMEAQGNTSSNTTINKYENYGGDMPVQGIVTETNASATQDISPDVSIPMPLDNPPLCSGAIPIEQAFPGMATSHGVRPTRDMQLKPTAFSRQQMEIFNPAETKFETLLSHHSLLTKFTVDKSMPPGTELYKITLNTRMGLAEGVGIPLNVSILNQFMFWRGDIELTFVAVSTKFHSVRLQALMAYGSPGIVAGSRNVSYSSIMNFAPDDDGTNYVHKELIPFNAQTEFLRTYEGEGVTDPIQNYSLGTFGVYIMNSLIAPDTVSPQIEVLIFVKFLNPKLAVPRPNSPFTWNGYLDYDVFPGYAFRSSPEGDPFEVEVTETGTDLSVSNYVYTNGIPPLGSYTYSPDNSTPKITIRIVSGDNPGNRLVTVTGVEILDSSITVEFEPAIPTDSSRYQITNPLEIFILPVIPFTAEGPDDVTLIEDAEKHTAENLDIVVNVPTTMEETNDRENKPCKLEIGEKFEFTITDVHEIGRRYIRFVPIVNAPLEQFVVNSNTNGTFSSVNVNFGSQPSSPWRSLFAGWAGSVKYRFFRDSSGLLPQVTFVPYYNRNVSLPGVPILDSFSGNLFTYREITLISDGAVTGPLAREAMYPISDKSYIDVSIPFQSHYNFCYNSNTQDIAPISSGTISLIAQNGQLPLSFTAFGDDLRLGIFRPPLTTKFNMNVYSEGLAGFYKLST